MISTRAEQTQVEAHAPPPGPRSDATTLVESANTPQNRTTVVEDSTKVSEVQETPLGSGTDFLGFRLVRPLKVTSAEADLWLVERPGAGDPYVLKHYRYGIVPKPEIMAAVKQLRPEHVVRVLETGEQEGRYYEIQEHIRFGSLADWMRRDRFDEAQVRNLFSELAAALAHLHDLNILHRDIKPSNILVRSRDPCNLVLTDFGISSVSELSLHVTSINRTAAYAAPEALTGVVAKASDWWSVGVILIELLTGKHPLAGLNEQAINFQLVTKGIWIPADVPAEWQTVARGLLTRDHERRWGAEQARAWLAGERNLPVYSQPEALPSNTTAACKPFKFSGKEFGDPGDLAVAMAQDWDQSLKVLERGFVSEWIKSEVADHEMASELMDIAEDDLLNPDQKLMAALVVLKPSLALSFRGTLVDASWLEANPASAGELLLSSLPSWLVKLKNETWLTDLSQRFQSLKKEIETFGLQLNAEVTDRLLLAPETKVMELAHAHQLRFAGAPQIPRLDALVRNPNLSIGEAMVLMACNQTLLLTPEQMEKHQSLHGSRWINSLAMKFAPVRPAAVRFSIWQTRLRDYDAFLVATGQPLPRRSGKALPLHPVTNVSWNDAIAFGRWLTQKERKSGLIGPADEYRLPTDLEWSAAVGLGPENGATPALRHGRVPGVYPWGTVWPPPPEAGNYSENLSVHLYAGVSPVGRFPPNRFGLHDLGGNVREWCMDWLNPEERFRVLRGSTWDYNFAEDLLASVRNGDKPDFRTDTIGFRCVLASAG